MKSFKQAPVPSESGDTVGPELGVILVSVIAVSDMTVGEGKHGRSLNTHGVMERHTQRVMIRLRPDDGSRLLMGPISGCPHEGMFQGSAQLRRDAGE